MNNEIKCPNCGQVFTVDESRYASIVKQVRDKEFARDLSQRVESVNKQNQSDLQLAKSGYEKEIQNLKNQLDSLKQSNVASMQQAKMKSDQELSAAMNIKDQKIADLQAQLKAKEQENTASVDQANMLANQKLTETVAAKNQEIESLKAQLNANDQNLSIAVNEEAKKNANMIAELQQVIASLKAQLSAKDQENAASVNQANMAANQKLTETVAIKNQEIESLKAKLASKDQEKELALSEAAQSKEKELAQYKADITKLESEKKADIELANMKAQQELNKAVTAKEQEISTLKAEISKKDQQKELALVQLESTKNQEISNLNQRLTLNQQSYEEEKQRTKANYDLQLKMKEDEVAYYRDLKTKASTKMIGETLEQHCLISFNSIRPTAFRNAYFEKDNDARTGSKGDFIFRDYDEDGTEIISIMFEMKNEADQTASKHKNADFFKELDKDRKEKGCEYAVLVSLLERDSEEYTGITDVSYRYDKMYVVRPQCFIPIITLLRNAALNSLQYKKELAVVKNQNIDISHFEENMNSFQAAFSKNYDSARTNFNKAIEEIDKSIDHLQKIKSALTTSENQLRLANDKAQKLTIKKLTKDAPSVKAMFDALDNED